MCDYDEYKYKCNHVSYPRVKICSAALANYKNDYKCDIVKIVLKVKVGANCKECKEKQNK